jgi:hypothetical protein
MDDVRHVSRRGRRTEAAGVEVMRKAPASSKGKSATTAGASSDLTASRHFQMGVILGPPAHGKTSLTDEMDEAYRRKGGRVIIVDPSNNWPGRGVWPGMAGLDKYLDTLRTSGPALLILDDADRYMRFPTNARLELMTSFRHWQKDVILVSRRPQGIPKDAIANADWLAVFAVREVYARRYIAEQIGRREVMKALPTERYQYLYFHQETGAFKVFSTKARKMDNTLADAKRLR